jgi:hypothetical protein
MSEKAHEPAFGFGIVIRADGSVPFDDDVHPDHRAHMIAHLVGLGHHVEPHRHAKGHFFIKNWKKPE